MREAPSNLLSVLGFSLVAIACSVSLPTRASAQSTFSTQSTQGTLGTFSRGSVSDLHAAYDVELEPHLIWQWNANELAQDDGIGLGFRASIPIVRRGPIDGLDNNLAISAGLSWATFLGCRARGAGCRENDVWIPAVAQWNIWLTPNFSLFPEVGLGFRDAIIRSSRCTGGSCTYSSLEVHPVMWFGARFRIQDTVAIVARLGTPFLQLGASFNL